MVPSTFVQTKSAVPTAPTPRQTLVNLAGKASAVPGTPQAPFPSKAQQTDLISRYRKFPPSFVVHQYAGYFKLAPLDIPFPYDGFMKVLWRAIEDRELPADLLDIFDACKIRYFEGCLIVEIVDHRKQDGRGRLAVAASKVAGPEACPSGPPGTTCLLSKGQSSGGIWAAGEGRVRRVVLRPTPATLWADITSMAEASGRAGQPWSQETAVEVESKLLLATQPPLCLDPSPAVMRLENAVLHERAAAGATKFMATKRRQRDTNGTDKESLLELKKLLFLMHEKEKNEGKMSFAQSIFVENSRKRKASADSTTTFVPPPESKKRGKRAAEAMVPIAEGNKKVIKTLKLESKLTTKGARKQFCVVQILLLPDGAYEGMFRYGDKEDTSINGDTLRWKMPSETITNLYIDQLKDLSSPIYNIKSERPTAGTTHAVKQRTAYEAQVKARKASLDAYLGVSCPTPKELLERALAHEGSTVPEHLLAAPPLPPAATLKGPSHRAASASGGKSDKKRKKSQQHQKKEQSQEAVRQPTPQVSQQHTSSIPAGIANSVAPQSISGAAAQLAAHAVAPSPQLLPTTPAGAHRATISPQLPFEQLLQQRRQQTPHRLQTPTQMQTPPQRGQTPHSQDTPQSQLTPQRQVTPQVHVPADRSLTPHPGSVVQRQVTPQAPQSTPQHQLTPVQAASMRIPSTVQQLGGQPFTQQQMQARLLAQAQMTNQLASQRLLQRNVQAVNAQTQEAVLRQRAQMMGQLIAAQGSPEVRQMAAELQANGSLQSSPQLQATQRQVTPQAQLPIQQHRQLTPQQSAQWQAAQAALQGRLPVSAHQLGGQRFSDEQASRLSQQALAVNHLAAQQLLGNLQGMSPEDRRMVLANFQALTPQQQRLLIQRKMGGVVGAQQGGGQLQGSQQIALAQMQHLVAQQQQQQHQQLQQQLHQQHQGFSSAQQVNQLARTQSQASHAIMPSMQQTGQVLSASPVTQHGIGGVPQHVAGSASPQLVGHPSPGPQAVNVANNAARPGIHPQQGLQRGAGVPNNQMQQQFLQAQARALARNWVYRP